MDRPQRSRCASPCPGIRKHTRGHSGPATHGRSLSPAPAGASWGPSPSRLTPTRGAYFPVWHPPRLRGSVAVCNAFPRPAHGRSRLCHPGPPCCRLRAAAHTAESGRVVRSTGHTAHATVVHGCAIAHTAEAMPPRLPGHAKLTREWSQKYACLRSGRRTGQCNVAHTDTARLDCPRLALGCQAMFWPPIGSATRSTRRCALPHLIAPRGAQRSAPAPLHSARVMTSCHPPSPSCGGSANRCVPGGQRLCRSCLLLKAARTASVSLRAFLLPCTASQCHARGLLRQGETPSGGGATPGTGAHRGPRRVGHGSQDVDATADGVRCAPWTAQQVPLWQVMA